MKRIVMCIAILVIVSFALVQFGIAEGSEPRLRTSLSWSNASFIGEEASDQAGFWLSGGGDVNGDGFDDVLIGAPYNDAGGSGAGQVYLILGKKSGWAMDTDLSSASASFIGEDTNDMAGCSVAIVGDVNGDGYDDIMIGAYQDADGGSYAGQAYLIFGRSTGWAMDTDLSTSSASFWGEDVGDQAGRSVSGVGDVNADGYDDILIGASADDDGGADAGQVYLILGKKSGWAMDTDLSASSASFWGENANDYTAWSDGAGDVNGDGYGDLLIGCDNSDEAGVNSGQVYLILGKGSGWAMDVDLSASSASFWGESTNDHLGLSVEGDGDVNGDGFDDILMGAYGDNDGGSSAGQSYLVLGRPTGWAMDASISTASASFIGEDVNDKSGISVSSVGDVDDDGYDDILIGAVENGYKAIGAGQAYLIKGKASGWIMDQALSSADASFLAEDSWDGAGRPVSGAGDVNGDGFDDILIGAYNDEEGGNGAGQVYLILSSTDPPGPKNIRSSLSPDQAQITLRWDAPDAWAEPFQCYRIYRSTDGSDDQYLGWTGTSTRTYVDITVSIGSTYRYEVITDYGQGDNYLGKAMISVLCDIDTDLDGIGDMADWDDDDDKVADQSDAFPLDSKEWLDTDLDGEGNEVDTDDDNDGSPDTDDPEPFNPLNGLELDLSTMHTELIETKDEITLMLEGIGSDLDDINDTLLQRIDELDLKISAQIYQLGVLMESVNTSIDSQLRFLDSDLSAFRSDMDAGLGTISASLDENQIDIMNELNRISGQIDALSISLEGVNNSILDSLEAGLTGISTEFEGMDENISVAIGILLQRIGEYRSDTNGRIQNVTDLMATMQELQALSDTTDRIETDLDTLNALQTGVGDIQKEQEDTTSSLSLNTILLMVAIVLLIVMIALGILILMRLGRSDRSIQE